MAPNNEFVHLATVLMAFLSVASTISTSEAFYIDEQQSPAQAHWSYSEQNEWSRGFPQCGPNRRRQSPIDIRHHLVVPNNQLALKFTNYDKRIRFKVINAHHTIKLNPLVSRNNEEKQSYDVNTAGDHEHSSSVSIDSNSGQRTTGDSNAERRRRNQEPSNHQDHLQSSNHHEPVDGNNQIESDADMPSTTGIHQGDQRSPMPLIKLEWMDEWNNEYRLHDIHFHWGGSRDSGSEHLIDGRRSAMEMHMVHIKKGLDKERVSIEPDSVAVIAVMVETNRKSNANFNPVVNALTAVNMSDVPALAEFGTIYDLMPQNLQNFYTYQGSLTTPPCYEVVNWIVMQQHVYINAKQMELFRNLYARVESDEEVTDASDRRQLRLDTAHRIMPNFRQPQNLSGRVIMSSFLPQSIGETGNGAPTIAGSLLLACAMFVSVAIMTSLQLERYA